MNLNEALQFTDQLIFQQSGKHLDDLQKTIIEGTWHRKTYQEIAQNSNLSEKHIADVAYHLWELLSLALGEDIKKSNFRSSLERISIESSPNSLNFYNINGNNNSFYPPQTLNNSDQSNQAKTNNNNSQAVVHDLILAPQIIKFYDREVEFKKLNHYIFNQNIRLISVLGITGIGKTYLVKRFIDLNLDQFEIIIWKNLKITPSLNQIIKEILAKIDNLDSLESSENSEIYQFLKILKEKRCLIILDQVETIFMRDKIAGQYQPESEDYQNFFKIIAETQHQSNLILISQEKSNEMNCLDPQLDHRKCLELSGLKEANILENTGLKNQDHWLQLIELYEGNFNYLKDIVTLIVDVYDGEVGEFLGENSQTKILPVITNQMRSKFNELLNRLSKIERQIIVELSKFDQPRSREQLNQKLSLSSVDFINGLQSLQQRYLLSKIKQDKILFKISPILREYVKNYGQDWQ